MVFPHQNLGCSLTLDVSMLKGRGLFGSGAPETDGMTFLCECAVNLPSFGLVITCENMAAPHVLHLTHAFTGYSTFSCELKHH